MSETHPLSSFNGSTAFGSVYLVEQYDSGSANGSRIDYIYRGLPEDGPDAYAYVIGQYDAGNLWKGLPILGDQCRLQIGADFATLTVCVSSASEGGSTSTPDNTPRFMPEFVEEMVPIELHPKYHPLWNKSLFYCVQATPESLAAPTPGRTIPDKYALYNYNESNPNSPCRAIAAEDQDCFRFSQGQPPDEYHGPTLFRWIEHIKPKFPQLQVYPLNTLVVNETLYFRSKSSAVRACAVPNQRKVPGETFGYPSGNTHWIVKPQALSFDGSRYIVSNKYFYADEWNPIIYEFPAVNNFSGGGSSSASGSGAAE